MSLDSLIVVIPVIAAVVLMFLRGWRKAAVYLLPGIGILTAGVILTAALRGNVIFIGAIVVGALLTLRGFYYLVIDA